jgi:hypothetical protein
MSAWKGPCLACALLPDAADLLSDQRNAQNRNVPALARVQAA